MLKEMWGTISGFFKLLKTRISSFLAEPLIQQVVVQPEVRSKRNGKGRVIQEEIVETKVSFSFVVPYKIWVFIAYMFRAGLTCIEFFSMKLPYIISVGRHEIYIRNLMIAIAAAGRIFERRASYDVISEETDAAFLSQLAECVSKLPFGFLLARTAMGMVTLHSL